MSFPAYDEYKDSGVDWLGDIPAHWSLKPLKRCIERNDGGVWGSDPDDDEGDTVVLRSTEQTVDGEWRIEEPAKRKLTQDEVDSALLIEGDLLVTKSSGSALHIGKTTIVSSEIAELRCCYSNFMQRLRTSTSLIPKLAWYVLNNNLARRQFDFLANSTTGLANLNSTMIGQVLISLPPPDEQQAISSFLDVETSKIDGLVSEQRRLIELLKEKRQAVISHAVTKGLNTNAPMKPSGVQWLGDVPQHWSVTAIKHMCREITDGAHVSPETENGKYSFVSTKDVSEDGIDFENCLRTSEASYDYLLRTGCQPFAGDVLFSKDGTIGRTVIVHEDSEFVVASSLIILRPLNEKLDSTYLHHLCQSNNVKNQVERFVRGAGLPRLSITNLCKVIGCFPPLDEQREIGHHLNQEVKKYSQLQAEAERAIELLQERRTALISAAVTGKIDVRDHALRETA